MIAILKDKLKHRPKLKEQSWAQYYEVNEALFGMIIFVGGFLFDVLTLSDVDDLFSLTQQAVYLLLIGLFLYFETLEHLKSWSAPPWLLKIWVIKEIGQHFLLGSLLSVYSLFFFKSASLATSFVFLGVMAFLLVANEFPQLQKRGPIVRWALWTLCLMCFFQIIVPIGLGFVGVLPFLLAWILSAAVMFALYWLMTKGHSEHIKEFRSLLWPAAASLAVFLILYIFKVVPPVPLVLSDIGIYHKVERIGDEYILTEEKPWWRFWHRGDQDFQAKPGDVIYVYVAVSSPARIQDEIRLRWMYDDPRQGWVTSDLIPLTIKGGRGAGYRGVANKSRYQDGKWRVQVETTDEREIGRLSFWVTKTNATATPAEQVEQPAEQEQSVEPDEE